MRYFPATILVLSLAACEGDKPPPPVLVVTSPARALTQTGGQITVTGTALPNANGDPVTKVTVNDAVATLAADGSFTATIDAPVGATLIETVASSEYGGTATDARAVHVGQLHPVGSTIPSAVTAALGTDAFARIAATAVAQLEHADLMSYLGALGPQSFSDSILDATVTLTGVTIGNIAIALTPTDAGLMFSAEVDAPHIAGILHYSILGIGSTNPVTAAADKITISGTLSVTPAGTSGFATKIASPSVNAINPHITSTGLTGDIFDLFSSNLQSTLQAAISTAAENALQPLINSAVGALGGPQDLEVLGKTLHLQASPASIAFSHAGATVALDLQVAIAGSESSPGFIITPNGTPTLAPATAGVELGLADDLVNELIAEIHAMGLLDLHLDQDFQVFDHVDIKLGMPPMISANNADGSLRLVLGDMIASFSDHGTKLGDTAINAQVDLSILRGATADQIALKFGDVKLWVNLLDSGQAQDGGEIDFSGAASAGIGVQLDSLSQFLVTLPLPSVAGVSFDNLEMHADSGYLMMSAEIH